MKKNVHEKERGKSLWDREGMIIMKKGTNETERTDQRNGKDCKRGKAEKTDFGREFDS